MLTGVKLAKMQVGFQRKILLLERKKFIEVYIPSKKTTKLSLTAFFGTSPPFIIFLISFSLIQLQWPLRMPEGFAD
jgi:hypothetical protein